VARAFRPWCRGIWRARAEASGDVVRDQRGMRRCPGGERDGEHAGDADGLCCSCSRQIMRLWQCSRREQ
jgi:hypothetical protein